MITSGQSGSEARDKDARPKQNTPMQKGRRENSRGPGDHVQIDQRKANKLLTTQVPKPLQVTGKYGNEVTMMSPEGVK